MEEHGKSDIINMGRQAFLEIHSAVVEKNPRKTAVRFYGVVKTTYGFVKEDKRPIDKKRLNGMIHMTKELVGKMLIHYEWSNEQIEEFENELSKLWVPD